VLFEYITYVTTIIYKEKIGIYTETKAVPTQLTYKRNKKKLFKVCT